MLWKPLPAKQQFFNPGAYKPDQSGINPEWLNVRRILAVRLDNIGDVVMLSPALRAIKQAMPEAHITLLASPGGSLVAPLIPWIEDVITWRALWQDISGAIQMNPEREQELVSLLHSYQFDAAVIFTSFSQSPYPPAYACYLAGIPLRLGHSNEFGGGVLSHWAKPPDESGHQVDRNLSLLAHIGIENTNRHMELMIPDEAQHSLDQKMLLLGLDPQEPFIALAPGASAAARRYDVKRFAMVVQEISAITGLPQVILGSAGEADKISPVTNLATPDGPVFSLVGQTSVPELAALIQRASLLVANNSASLHIADAYEKPVVILYSGTEYITQWEPRFSQARILRRETFCSPCYKFQCPYQMECLDIPSEEVSQAVLDLLVETERITA
ncbi:MAG: glycosyltransferase family 9 protein [Omnitrophica WOR_2 bacterium]